MGHRRVFANVLASLHRVYAQAYTSVCSPRVYYTRCRTCSRTKAETLDTIAMSMYFSQYMCCRTRSVCSPCVSSPRVPNSTCADRHRCRADSVQHEGPSCHVSACGVKLLHSTASGKFPLGGRGARHCGGGVGPRTKCHGSKQRCGTWNSKVGLQALIAA